MGKDFDSRKIYNQGTVATIAATMLLLTVATTYIISVICFMLGIGVEWWQFPLSIVVSAIVATAICSNLKIALRSGVLTLAVILTSLVVCDAVDDFSYDGNFYHQEIVAYLLQGWNPFLQPEPDFDCSLWAEHYPKAMEIMASCIASTTGLIETGKAINLLIIVGSGFLTYSFICRNFATISQREATMTTLVFILCPVGICQALTFYNDFVVYYAVMIAVMLTINLYRRFTVSNIMALALLIIVAAGVKLTAIFYVGLAIALTLAWMVVSRRLWRRSIVIAVVAVVALCIGMTVTGYHPYVTNYISRGNPLYPLMGDGAVDIMTYNTPDEMACNRFLAFFKSVATITLPTTDSRAGGFGPLMIILLLAAAIGLTISKSRYRNALRYAALCAFLSCFIFEQSWWARYIPQLWLVPAIGMLAIVDTRHDRAVTTLKVTVVAAVMLTAVISFARVVASGIRVTELRNILYSVLESHETPIKVVDLTPAAKRHLAEKGIDVIAIEQDTIPAGVRIVKFTGAEIEYATKFILPDDVSFDDFKADSPLHKMLLLKGFLYQSDTVTVIPRDDE